MDLNSVIQEHIFSMMPSFVIKQSEWAGMMLPPASNHLPFTASNSDNVFAPTSGGPTPQPQFFVLNPLHFQNNSTYNHFPDTFCTPTAQTSQHFIHDTAPHLPSPPLLPQCVHPVHLLCIHSPTLHNNFPQTNILHFSCSALGFLPQHPPYYFNPHSNPVPISYPLPNHLQNHTPVQYVYLPSPFHSVTPEVAVLPSASKSLPVISSILLLNLKTDFYAWDEGVSMILWHLGILGHILDLGMLKSGSVWFSPYF